MVHNILFSTYSFCILTVVTEISFCLEKLLIFACISSFFIFIKIRVYTNSKVCSASILLMNAKFVILRVIMMKGPKLWFIISRVCYIESNYDEGT